MTELSIKHSIGYLCVCVCVCVCVSERERECVYACVEGVGGLSVCLLLSCTVCEFVHLSVFVREREKECIFHGVCIHECVCILCV